MKPSGRHLLLDLDGCDAKLLDDEAALVALVERACRATGSTVLSVHAHHFSPHGVTIVALLAESHASLHTFPESRRAFWDCFTCGESDPVESEEVITEGLEADSARATVVSRSFE